MEMNKVFGVLSCVVALFLVGISEGAERVAKLEIGAETYYNVLFKSANASNVTIFHSKGLSQISLKDLPPELQGKFGYSPEKEEEQKLLREQSRADAIEREKARIDKLKAAAEEKEKKAVESDGWQFGETPIIEKEIDLRKNYRDWGIRIRDQGKRASCAIYSTMACLEYMHARETGEAVNLSEWFTMWSTLKSLGRFENEELWNSGIDGQSDDAGFLLPEVFQAIENYGVALNKEVSSLKLLPEPPRIGFLKRANNSSKWDSQYEDEEEVLDTPSDEFLKACRSRIDFKSVYIPGRDADVLMMNMIKVLNEGIPLVIGTGWPNYGAIKNSSLLNSQKPREDYGHAVAIVGYTCPDGKLESTRFLFRNSWGVGWGLGGYGKMTYSFLSKNLYSAYYLDLLSPLNVVPSGN